MVRLKIIDEEEYTNIPVSTRARMIAAEEGPKMISALDQDKQLKEIERKSKQKSG